MIDKVIAILESIPLPSPIKEDAISEIRQIHETGASVSQQNHALYSACGVIKRMLPNHYAETLCYYLCNQLTVAVPSRVVYGAIRKNRNTPIKIAPTDIVDDVMFE